MYIVILLIIVSLGRHSSCVNMGPPDTLFKEAEALFCDRDASQYLSLTSPVV